MSGKFECSGTRPSISTLMALAIVALAGTENAASSNASRPVYVYLKGQKWCGVSDLAAFRRKAALATANRQDVDEGTVWFSGDKITAAEEFRTDADAQWSTLSKYHLDLAGNVTSADGSFRSDDTGIQKAAFVVANGSYKLIKGPRGVSTYKFRRASTLASFPFAPLARTFASSTVKESCG